MIKNIGLKNESGIAQKISRKVRFLKENAISNYRLNLSWKIFDLFHSIIIHGKCDKSLARKIRNYLMSTDQIETSRLFTDAKFPFPCFFKITEDGFLWYVRAPPTHINQLLDFVWGNCSEYDLFLLSYKYSQVYSLWDKTFNEAKNNWKTSKDFMIDSVLSQLF
jgi:hypothetical protein